METLSKYTNYKTLNIIGCYLNYYENSNCYTSSCKHLKTLREEIPRENEIQEFLKTSQRLAGNPEGFLKTLQIIISLGATRTLLINNKKYNSNNGDVFIFNEQMHGVPKEKSLSSSGSISISIFCSYTLEGFKN
jgi:hypothetical protein